jgi:hypothetical protein
VAAVQSVRAINTIQAKSFAATGRYASSEELASSADVQNQLNSSGFKLSLVAGPSSYVLMLVDESDPCKYALFSSEAGQIYQGHPLK